MPGFVKTPADEEKWSRAKKAAGKSTPKGSESYWKLSNYIFHKSEGNLQVAEFYKNEFMKSLTSVPSISAGTTVPSGTKMPKPKSMPKAEDKPSKFWKSEFCKSESSFCKNEDIKKTTDDGIGRGMVAGGGGGGFGRRRGIMGGMGIGIMGGGLGMMLNEKNVDKSEAEEFTHVKHPTLAKLVDLLENSRSRNKG